jgi:beta-galactosidase
MLYMMSEDVIAKLAAFCENGGTLVSGFFSGVVNENDLCYLGGCPGGILKDVFGVRAEEIDTLMPNETKRVSDGVCEYSAFDFCEIIHAESAKTLLTYGEDYYRDMPAACKNEYGKGHAYYIAFRDSGSFLDKLYGEITTSLDIDRLEKPLPSGVWQQKRGDYIFVGNYTDKPIEYEIPKGYACFYPSGEAQKITVGGFGTLILKRNT